MLLMSPTLVHDTHRRLVAIVNACNELDAQIPSPWCFEQTMRIKALAQGILDAVNNETQVVGSPTR